MTTSPPQCHNPVLCCSSLAYLSNAMTCMIMGETVYSSIFMALVATSLLFHSNKPNIFTNLLDKIPVTGIVTYGGYKYAQNLPNASHIIYGMCPVMTFMATAYLYVYGYMCGEYCYHPDAKWSTRYHALLHVISSIGHHTILLLL